jgi:hypothetical protein
MKRRKLSVFSLSFIDCICCGLGAIILLFVVVNAQNAERRVAVTTELTAETNRLEEEVLEGRRNLVRARNALEETTDEIARTEGLSRKILETLPEKKVELADRDQRTLAAREHINRLKSDLKSLEEDVKRLQAGAKREEELGRNLRPFPGRGDRQYLTGLKMGGGHIFILVDASASMLDETVVGAVRRRNMSDGEKLKAPKWRRAVATVDWLTANMPADARFQLYTFSETAAPVIEASRGTWFAAGDVERLNQAVAQLRRVVPGKGTSLFNAFDALARMSPAPDNVFLLTDGLPTMGREKPWASRVSADRRLSLFREAAKRLPAGIPVNVILFPMEGDPMAASAFWRLAIDTRGSFICPARDWP